MWKSFVKALIESCVACEPMVYLYWKLHLLEVEAGLWPEPEQSTSRRSSEARLNLVRGRSEVSA